jgi:hydroxyacylglutathione hydrolase
MMFLERFEDRGLAQYSYALGCEKAKAMAVVDPRRDVEVYLRFAAERGMAISHVLETHIHADFASGARELAERSGASLCLSAYDEGEAYKVRFPHRPLREGDGLQLGTVRIEPLHTPGHTPEHLSFLVYDHARSEGVPMLLLSGDFLFIGSVGRPDLLGEEAKRALASRLFDSVRGKLAGLPDGLEIHPGHGAGSMCGAGMSGRPTSTLGYERIANPYLDPGLSREAFVDRLLSNVPPFPGYYRRMKELNSAGPPSLGELPGKVAVPVEEFRRLASAEGRLVIDLRDAASFGAGHVPGSFGIGGTKDLSTWASWTVPYDRPLLLVAPHPGSVAEAVCALVRVGLDGVEGYLDGGMEAWKRAGYEIADLPQWPAAELARRLASPEPPDLLDVRSPAEWRTGHVDGARHIPAYELEKRLAEVPESEGRPLAIVCGSGYRSTVTASLLERHGRTGLVNVAGGMNGWIQAGLPTVTG